MTIRDLNNWCSTCQEACFDHATICTVCGTTLQAAPPPPQTSSSSSSTRRLTTTMLVPVLPEFLTNDLRQASREWRMLLRNGQDVNGNGEVAPPLPQQQQLLPPEAMDPTQQQRRQRATATATLKSLPRIVVQKYCFLFHTATLEYYNNTDGKDNHTSNETTTTTSSRRPNNTTIIPAILGELDWRPTTTITTTTPASVPHHFFQLDAATTSLVLAEPRTGKGGQLKDSCIQQIQSLLSSSSSSSSSISNDVIWNEETMSHLSKRHSWPKMRVPRL
jgi:hypothetical protein